jgi:UDP-N-acetylglucosamine 2-epimerase
MTVKRITTVVGARPQFIKCSLLSHELRRRGLRERLVHTGQHYDPTLSEIFFRQLEIPEVDVNLEVGAASNGRQIARIITALEADLERERPDLVLVFGDTRSTLAAAVVASGQQIPLAHVEAGLRCRNRSIPEENNRVVTDHLADLLFCHNEVAAEQLRAEQIQGRIVVSGDTMRQTVNHFLPRALADSPLPARLALAEGEYTVLTLHRPFHADRPEVMAEILRGCDALGGPVVFPVHPRTRARNEAALAALAPRIHCIEPLGYLDMLALVRRARLLLTDSGGLQKEAAYLGTPCVVLRGETEWNEPIEMGLNVLAGDFPGAEELARLAHELCDRHAARMAEPGFMDNLAAELDARFGPPDAAERITEAVLKFLA